IPTVFLAYGHKHRGFATLLQQEKYVFEGRNPENLKLMVEVAWKNREEITRILKDRMVRVKELVNLNFEIVKKIVDLNKSERNHIPKKVSDSWVKKGA
ncbi:MAG: hypothetical protein KAR20_19055, partial [Candidatus Heimdallarchaeota archaeon]|nr:hypothetical protein [Candidatus Heimdallarchaeota archaeon]